MMPDIYVMNDDISMAILGGLCLVALCWWGGTLLSGRSRGTKR